MDRIQKMDDYRSQANRAVKTRTDLTPGDKKVIEDSTINDEPLVRSQKVFSRNGIMRASAMARIVAHVDTRYLFHVMDHIRNQREKLLSGNMPLSDLTKAYLYAVISQGSLAVSINTFEQGLGGRKVPDIYVENGKIRPEGAAAYVLTETIEGQRLLEEVEAGTITQTTATEFTTLFAPFGKSRPGDISRKFADLSTNEKFSRFNQLFLEPEDPTQINLSNFAKEMEPLRSGQAVKDGTHHEFMKRLRNINAGKTGFMGHFFGIGDRGVIDVREVTMWLYAHEADTKSKQELKKRLENANVGKNKPLIDDLFKRIEDVGISVGFPPESAAYLAHHLIWDFVKSEVTHHAGLYYSFTGTKPLYDEAIRLAKENQQQVRSTLEKGYSPEMDLYASAQLMEIARDAKNNGISLVEQTKRYNIKTSANIWKSS